MAEVKISQLPAATTPLAGTELVEIVQGGANKKVAANELGGTATLQEDITYAALLVKINAGTLSKGQQYKITDADPDLYGGSTVIVTAVSTNKLSGTGTGIFYNPKYDQDTPGFGIWSSGGSYNADDTVIWGGKHWTNLNGQVGEAIDDFTLNEEWEAIVFNSTDYNLVSDEVEYDVDNNVISLRKDNFNNTVEAGFATRDYTGSNAIKAFPWGNGYNGDVGLGNNNISESQFDIINFTGTRVFDNVVGQDTYFFENLFLAQADISYNRIFNSVLEGNTFGQVFTTNILYTSTYSNNVVTNTTPVTENRLYGSEIKNNTFTNGGELQRNALNQFSSIRNCTLSNCAINDNNLTVRSEIYSNNFTDSDLFENTLINSSKIYSNTLTGSGGAAQIKNNILERSLIHNNTIDTNDISGNKLFGYTLTGQTAEIVNQFLQTLPEYADNAEALTANAQIGSSYLVTGTGDIKIVIAAP